MGGLLSIPSAFPPQPGGPSPLSVLLGGGLSYLSPHWITVRQRFEQFHSNLLLTPTQTTDGYTKRAGVVSCLNRAYYGTNSGIDHSFFIGSWAKNTAIRTPRDVDMYFLLPAEVYYRFQGYAWARQSALLQEVKETLAGTYPDTDMSGDGQVVVVKFDSYSVEVVPAFALTAPGEYWICDTHDGGAYKRTMPWAEVNQLEAVDLATARNLRPLIRMLKAWQAYCSVPIKSFHLELVASAFIAQSAWRLHDWLYFDWLFRDFFAFLYHRANWTFFVPGTNEPVPLGNEWQSRAETAYDRAAKACDYERDNWVMDAGDEWQKVFGPDIPRVL